MSYNYIVSKSRPSYLFIQSTVEVLFLWVMFMKNKKDERVKEICFKFSHSCKRCPRNAECENEAKKDEKKKEVK